MVPGMLVGMCPGMLPRMLLGVVLGVLVGTPLRMLSGDAPGTQEAVSRMEPLCGGV